MKSHLIRQVLSAGELKRCDPRTVEAARKANRYKYMSQSVTACSSFSFLLLTRAMNFAVTAQFF